MFPNRELDSSGPANSICVCVGISCINIMEVQHNKTAKLRCPGTPVETWFTHTDTQPLLGLFRAWWSVLKVEENRTSTAWIQAQVELETWNSVGTVSVRPWSVCGSNWGLPKPCFVKSLQRIGNIDFRYSVLVLYCVVVFVSEPAACHRWVFAFLK